MTDLADRIEAAEGPSRELDAEIQVRLFEKPDYRLPDPVLNRRPADWQEAAGRFRWDGGGGHHAWPAYTHSLDAAMTLVPEGTTYAVGVNGRERERIWAWVDSPLLNLRHAATPALALCAAALRARKDET